MPQTTTADPIIATVGSAVDPAFIDAVKTALDKAGYDVAVGRADLFDINGAKELAKAFGTAFGNNPAAPYIVPSLPAATGEPYHYGDSMRSKVTNVDGQELHWTYRLGEHEALVVFGNLPPEAAFLGYETFLFTRHFDFDDLSGSKMDWMTHASGVQHFLSPNPDNLLYDSPPITADDKADYSNDPNRVMLFANGPTINRRDLEHKIPGSFWGKQAIFSTSGDADFEAVLNAQLGDLANIHIHSPLGSDLQMGTDTDADDFWTLMRYAVPKDRDEAEAWRTSVADQLVVLRVSKRDTNAAVNRHPVYEFETKDADCDERELAAGLQKIADAVSEQLSFGPAASQELGLRLSSMLHAPVSVPMAMSAVGATHDADYTASSARPFGSQEVVAIVGVNHAQTGNATYISMGIYDATIWQGIRGVSQAAEYPGPLTGSVEGFFGLYDGVPAGLGDIDDLSKYYVHIVARPTAGLPSNLVESDYCTVVYESTDDADSTIENPLVLEPGNPLRITERAYLNPSAGCGPAYQKMLSMILVAKNTDAPIVPVTPVTRGKGRRPAR